MPYTLAIVAIILGYMWVAGPLVDEPGPGGEAGGRVVAQGTPEQVAKSKTSATGQFLAEILRT